MTIQEASDYLGITGYDIRRLINRNRLNVDKDGNPLDEELQVLNKSYFSSLHARLRCEKASGFLIDWNVATKAYKLDLQSVIALYESGFVPVETVYDKVMCDATYVTLYYKTLHNVLGFQFVKPNWNILREEEVISYMGFVGKASIDTVVASGKLTRSIIDGKIKYGYNCVWNLLHTCITDEDMLKANVSQELIDIYKRVGAYRGIYNRKSGMWYSYAVDYLTSEKWVKDFYRKDMLAVNYPMIDDNKLECLLNADEIINIEHNGEVIIEKETTREYLELNRQYITFESVLRDECAKAGMKVSDALKHMKSGKLHVLRVGNMLYVKPGSLDGLKDVKKESLKSSEINMMNMAIMSRELNKYRDVSVSTSEPYSLGNGMSVSAIGGIDVDTLVSGRYNTDEDIRNSVSDSTRYETEFEESINDTDVETKGVSSSDTTETTIGNDKDDIVDTVEVEIESTDIANDKDGYASTDIAKDEIKSTEKDEKVMEENSNTTINEDKTIMSIQDVALQLKLSIYDTVYLRDKGIIKTDDNGNITSFNFRMAKAILSDFVEPETYDRQIYISPITAMKIYNVTIEEINSLVNTLGINAKLDNYSLKYPKTTLDTYYRRLSRIDETRKFKSRGHILTTEEVLELTLNIGEVRLKNIAETGTLSTSNGMYDVKEVLELSEYILTRKDMDELTGDAHSVVSYKVFCTGTLYSSVTGTWKPEAVEWFNSNKCLNGFISVENLYNSRKISKDAIAEAIAKYQLLEVEHKGVRYINKKSLDRVLKEHPEYTEYTISAVELAKILGIVPNTAKGYIAQGRIRGVAFRKSWYTNEEAIEEFKFGLVSKAHDGNKSDEETKTETLEDVTKVEEECKECDSQEHEDFMELVVKNKCSMSLTDAARELGILPEDVVCISRDKLPFVEDTTNTRKRRMFDKESVMSIKEKLLVMDVNTFDEVADAELTGDLVAKYYGVEEEYVRRLVELGKLPGGVSRGYVYGIRKRYADNYFRRLSYLHDTDVISSGYILSKEDVADILLITEKEVEDCVENFGTNQVSLDALLIGKHLRYSVESVEMYSKYIMRECDVKMYCKDTGLKYPGIIDAYTLKLGGRERVSVDILNGVASLNEWSLNEVSSMLCISVPTLKKFIENGEIPANKGSDGRYHFPSSVLRFRCDDCRYTESDVTEELNINKKDLKNIIERKEIPFKQTLAGKYLFRKNDVLEYKERMSK